MEIKYVNSRCRKFITVHETKVNTAPGLEGTTLINYVNAFIGDLN